MAILATDSPKWRVRMRPKAPVGYFGESPVVILSFKAPNFRNLTGSEIAVLTFWAKGRPIETIRHLRPALALAKSKALEGRG